MFPVYTITSIFATPHTLVCYGGSGATGTIISSCLHARMPVYRWPMLLALRGTISVDGTIQRRIRRSRTCGTLFTRR